MDSRELQRRFKTAGWPGPTEIQALLAEAAPIDREEIERLLAILTMKGLPGDSRDQRNRCYVFAKLADPCTDKALFVPYVRALKVGDPVLASALIPLIPKVNNVEGHAELASLVRSPDGSIRKMAAQILKQIGGTTVFQALTTSCGQKDFQGRMEAMDALVSIGRQHAIPALSQVLLVGNVHEKTVALQHLGNAELMAKDLPAASRAIAPALTDPVERIAMQAVVCVGQLAGEDDFFEYVGPLLDAGNGNMTKAVIEGMKRFRSPRVFEALERKLREGPNSVRMAVLATAEAIGCDEVLPIVVSALNTKRIDIRTRAGEVLTSLALAGKVDIARTILWLLRSKDVNVRRMAVDIAKKVGDPNGEMAPKLLRHLRDEDWWVRERVMDALVEMAGRQLTRHLVAYLQDPSDVVRRYAVDALDRVKDPAALGALVRAAQTDTDWWVRERSVEVMATLNDARAIPYLVDLLNKQPELQRVCVDALGRMGAQAAAAPIAALIEAADTDMRLVILEALKLINDPAQIELVTPMQQDGDHRVRSGANELLMKWNSAIQTPGPAVGAAKAYSLLERLLIALAQAEGDDLIVAGGHRPYIKKMGKVTPLANHIFSAEQIKGMLLPCLSAKHVQDLSHLKDADFSFEIKAEALRFRANVFQQMAGVSAVFRIVKDKVPLLEELGLPPVVKTFAELKNGLVLVGGPTGSGKSTTLAGIIDHINRSTARHIVTLEDPIEVIHRMKKSLLNQREIGTHTRSFESALRATLRQDPDVILVGEMRDLPTIQFALTAAETGHLVLGTLHTVSVDTSVDRLINAFPPGQQPQVRSLLADTLRAVMCQYLLKRKDKEGARAIAVEIMINNDAIANLIRKEKTFQIPSVIATQRDAGMQSMDSDLERLYKAGVISSEDAYVKAQNKKNMEVSVGMTTEGKAEEGKQPPVAVRAAGSPAH